jgi:hypothetical protein
MTKTQLIHEVIRLIGKIEYRGDRSFRFVWLIGVLVSLLVEVMYRDSLYRRIVLGKLKDLAKEPNKTY